MYLLNNYGSQSGTCEYLSFNLKSTLEEKYDTFYIDSIMNETEQQFDIWISKIIGILNV